MWLTDVKKQKGESGRKFGKGDTQNVQGFISPENDSLKGGGQSRWS